MEENDKIVAALTKRLAQQYDKAAKQVEDDGRLALNRVLRTEDTYYFIFFIPRSDHPEVSKIISEQANLIASEMSVSSIDKQVALALPDTAQRKEG